MLIKLEGSDYPLRCNSYLIEGKPRIQIDAGSKTDADILILTHCHFDHILFAKEMKENGTRIYASKETANAVERMSEEVYDLSGNLKPFNVDVIVKEGDKIGNENIELTVIETPGHCKGAICLWEKNKRWLFSGDTIFDIDVYGRTDLIGGNENELKKSIERLLKLHPRTIFSGHGDVVHLKPSSNPHQTAHKD